MKPRVRCGIWKNSAVALLLPLLLSTLHAAEPFQFKDGDMVVLLGNTFVERAQQSGYLERELTLAAETANVRFRNLAWSGDTVYGDARSYFGPPQEGFDRLTAQMEELQPNVIIVNYGAVAAFEGRAGIPQFLTGYNRLLDMIYEKAGPREIVLMSPAPAESLGGPLPDQTEQNRRLTLYRDAIQDLSTTRNFRFLDLFGALGAGKALDRKPLTDNGVHYSPNGYAFIAPRLVEQLGLESPAVDSSTAEKLRQLIIQKNRLYFHRWRPANETYLHLFRKHEQGNNAKELPMFEPLVKAKELEIQVYKELVLSKS